MKNSVHIIEKKSEELMYTKGKKNIQNELNNSFR